MPHSISIKIACLFWLGFSLAFILPAEAQIRKNTFNKKRKSTQANSAPDVKKRGGSRYKRVIGRPSPLSFLRSKGLADRKSQGRTRPPGQQRNVYLEPLSGKTNNGAPIVGRKRTYNNSIGNRMRKNYRSKRRGSEKAFLGIAFGGKRRKAKTASPGGNIAQNAPIGGRQRTYNNSIGNRMRKNYRSKRKGSEKTFLGIAFGGKRKKAKTNPSIATNPQPNTKRNRTLNNYEKDLEKRRSTAGGQRLDNIGRAATAAIALPLTLLQQQTQSGMVSQHSKAVNLNKSARRIRLLNQDAAAFNGAIQIRKRVATKRLVAQAAAGFSSSVKIRRRNYRKMFHQVARFTDPYSLKRRVQFVRRSSKFKIQGKRKHYEPTQPLQIGLFFTVSKERNFKLEGDFKKKRKVKYIYDKKEAEIWAD